VCAWLAAGTLLLVVWVWIWLWVAGARRRAAQGAAEARARARARRQRVPLVSANVRGQPTHQPDLWREASGTTSRDEHAA
jgi:hypothetical protein